VRREFRVPKYDILDVGRGLVCRGMWIGVYGRGDGMLSEIGDF